MSAGTAVVILNYNGKSFLDQFLPTVIECSPGADIWVIDNASTDGSVQFLAKNFLDVRIVQLGTNLGYAGGYQEGLRHIEAKYYVLLNSDVEVTPNWIEPMKALLDSDGTIAACQPKILSWHLRDSFEYAGAAGGFIDPFGYPFCRGRVFTTLEKDTGQYNDVREVFWATGACFFVRASAFASAGGLDPAFFAHMEEIDLCWRLKMAGHKVMYQGSSTVYHVGGGTLSSTSPYKTYLNFRNSIMMLLKNDPLKTLWWKIPLRFTIDFIILVKLMVSGQFANARSISRAHMYVIKNLRKYRLHNSRQSLGSMKGVYRGVAPISYTLGRRLFSQMEKKIQ